MPRVHFVKAARRDYPQHGIARGTSYYWWKPRVGGRGGAKRYSKTRPKPSQVTQSEFLAGVYAIQEDIGDAKPADFEELRSMRDGWVEEVRQIGEECQSKYDNMPDGLQQGETGQLLEARAEAMENWVSELENVDLEPERDSPDGETVEESLEAALDELRGITPDEV